MKKIIIMLAVFVIAMSTVLPVYAENGKVTYDGNAREFVFEPGSDHSLTDLFTNFKGVMPGDTLTQRITVKNDASKKVKVKIYIRSLGAHEDSINFLSQLKLRVQKSEENEMAYMFDALASESAQMTDWICLGTLYSGGEVNLNVTLEVPIELGNEFQNEIGYLDWEFKVEEFPVEPGDPQAPQTSDDSSAGIYLLALCASVFIIIILLIWRKKDKEKEKYSVER